MPIPTATAHTGSVPINRLARLGDVRRTAHVWAANANTVQTSARYTSLAHDPADSASVWRASSGRATTPSSTVPTTAWIAVRRSVSIGRARVSSPMSVTCTARTPAAASISPSPQVGAWKPCPETSRPTPTTASAAATKNGPGSHVRLHALASTGVNTTVRLMISPALVAEVCATPNVSSVSTAACVHPSTVPDRTSSRVGRRRRRAASGTSATALIA